MIAVVTMRLRQMRKSATADGKGCPPLADLQALASRLADDGMKCPHCRRVMNWRNSDGRSTVVTLQHDRDGGVRLICFACNVRHQHFPGDQFYEKSGNSKHCHGCDTTKPLTEFYATRAKGTGGFSSRCKACQKVDALRRYEANKSTKQAQHREWVKKNRQHASAYERERRKRKRASQCV